MDEHNEFSKIIKILRTKYSLSQEDLAFRCGLQTSYISKIERGSHRPNLNTINKMAQALDMSKSDLLAVDEKFLEIQDYDSTTFKLISITKTLTEEQRLQLLAIAKTFLH